MTPKRITIGFSLKDDFAKVVKSARTSPEFEEIKRIAEANGGFGCEIVPERGPDAPLRCRVNAYSQASADKIMAEISKNAAVKKTWIF